LLLCSGYRPETLVPAEAFENFYKFMTKGPKIDEERFSDNCMPIDFQVMP